MTMALVAAAKPSDADFLTLFNRLAIALRGEADNFGVTVGIYYDALADLPMAALEQGALDLMKQPGRKFFPTTAEWREAAEQAHQQQLKAALTPARDEPWHNECTACHDTGWEVRSCDGTAGICGRSKAHPAHDYVKPCACRPINRTFQRHQHFGAGR
jgi:hypothetical protein